MVEHALPEPMRPFERVLEYVGRKISNGSELTLSDRLMAMGGTAIATRHSWGPVPAEMHPAPPELPETVKGVLASYVS